jgi:hypothetical protein
LSVMLTLAVRVPVMVGLKVTVMVQLNAGVKLDGQLLTWA